MIPAPSDTRVEARPLRKWLIAGLVFVLPLHTVFVPFGISWKPFLVLLIVAAGWDAVDGLRERRWPWHVPASIAATVFLGAMAVSWWGIPAARSSRLWLALGVGALLLLVIERALTTNDADRLVLRSIVWSATAVSVSAVALSFAVVGTFGDGIVDTIDAVPGVNQIAKAAYLEEGFVALTNWHLDPGYAAAWMNLWAALVIVAWARGWAFSRWWINALIVGGLVAGSFMTLSRTGWLGSVVAIVASYAFLVAKDREPIAKVTRFIAVSVASALALITILWLVDPSGEGTDLDKAVAYRITQGTSLGTPIGEIGGAGNQDTRSVVWPQYVEAFQANPAIGIGLGVGWATPGMQEPHNLGLQLLGETGIVGLLGFLSLTYAVGRYGAGTIGAVALTVVAASAFTQTVLFEPTLWFAGALYLGRTGVAAGDSSEPSESPIQL